MLKPILQTLFLAVFMLCPALARGGILTRDEAIDVAVGFFKSYDISRLADVNALTLVHVENVGSSPSYYIFNATDGQGFIIISADKTALPVIGYSTTSTWQPQEVPNAAGHIIGDAASTISTPLSRRVKSTQAKGNPMKVLKTPTWSQEAPFNNMIPNRRLVGCVGTAFAEILKYHEYPANRPQSLVKDGEPTAYAWDIMRDDNYRTGYTGAEADAVAAIMADAAISIGTDFGMSSSSAFEVKVPSALVSMFGYDAGVSYKKQIEMDRASWESLIVNEIDEGRPVLYCGQDVSTGHAFVCDGYDLKGSVAYFHINWGWGGAADGFYASDALNPTVSMSHNFSYLTTVVYNIKPATNDKEYSPIHITSDEKQVGLTVDVTDFNPGSKVSVRVGALKNISNNDFSGKVSMALFNPDGSFKRLLGEGRNLNVISLQILKYIDFNFTLPSDIDIADNDIVRLVTKDNASSAWLPVANDLLTIGEVKAKNNIIPYSEIIIPTAVEGVEITCPESRVIKGRDFSFNVVSKSPENVVTVKANGFILTPNAGNTYRVNNVIEDQEISIIVQNAADVVSKRNIWVKAGTLSQLIDDVDAGTITDLTLYGTIDVNDFTFMRERMNLSRLDISEVTISANGANPANAIPAKAFTRCGSLKQIILPRNVNTFKSGCFSYSGLTSIEIPASVSTYEYNIFLGCSRLSEVTVRRSAPAWVNWCVFNGTPKKKLIVPVGASAAYKNKEYWQDFSEVVEENPVQPSQYKVLMQDGPGVRFTPITQGTEVAPGSQYSFTVDTDESYGDATMELYANNTRLYADQSGVFKAVINSNTLIHVNFKQPMESGNTSPWKITAQAGGIGLVTDVVNVVVGKQFTIRANALAIPSDNASLFYCAALTDKDGRIKELISPVVANDPYNFGNLPCNFICQVKEASIREGNLIRIVSSFDKKKWSIVHADSDAVTDRLDAIGNRVVYHSVNMPDKVDGAVISGGATSVVRGMPFSLKVTPVSTADRITVSVNGINKVVDAAIANLSIPSVVEDLDIAIQVNPAGSDAYTVVNVREGELASKIAQCPSRLKIIGVMLSEDFDALRAHANAITDLDMADVTIKGVRDLANAIPSNAFASSNASVRTALSTIILPTNLVNIEGNAFNRCVNLKEITIPASVSYVGDNAFSSCVNLKKIIAQGNMPPSTGNMSPFPTNQGITLEVPKGAENNYNNASFWKDLNKTTSTVYFNIQIDPSCMFNYESYDISKVEYPGSGKVTRRIALPSLEPNKYKDNPFYRRGVAYKLYDNNEDVTYLSRHRYGVYSVTFDPAITDPQYTTCPQNHLLSLAFHYKIDFNQPSGVSAEFIDLDPNDKWSNVEMWLFDPDSSEKPTLYREGRDYRFRLQSNASNMEIKVFATSTIMTKPGKQPEFETREQMLVADDNGIYTLKDLQGDTEIRITASTVIEEGDNITSDVVKLVDKDDARFITNIEVSGEVDEETFAEIRDKFESLETLNLSSMVNETIPDNAFANMENLSSVVVSENVVTVGNGAFAGCQNLESITLPGVERIGEGAFEGCQSLTSITLLGQTGGTEPAQARRKSPKAAGFTAESFRGINPNCLIYVSEGNEAGIGELPNVIINKAGSRVANSDITLNGDCPFNAPASFSLADHRISLTVDVPGSLSDETDGWKGLILPFAPTDITFGETFTPRVDKATGIEKVLSILSFTDNSNETLAPQTAIEANRPYLISAHAPFDKLSVTFSATGKSVGDDIVYDVAYTPTAEELKKDGSMFSLYGSYNGEKENAGLYVLNENGSAFDAVASSEEVAVRPFSVYLCANSTEAPASFNIGRHPIWVFNPDASKKNGAKLYRSNKIELSSPTSGATVYYTLDGSDPAGSETRIAYKSPFSINEEAITVKTIAEFKGYYSDAVDFGYELRKADMNYALGNGWNWISHNVETAIPVEGIMGDDIERVLSQTQEIIRDPEYGHVGNLRSLNPLEAYKVYVSSEKVSPVVSGVSYDPANPVTLKKGWNWIGCPVEDSHIALEDALSNLEAEEGDMIVGRDGFSQVDADGKWIGTLNAFSLGQGYLYLSRSQKEFTYNTVPSSENAGQTVPKVHVKANAESKWDIISNKYPSVMPVTSRIVKENGLEARNGEYEIGAFCNDECRGIGIYVDGWVMINVYGNPGDMISFRVLSSSTGKEMHLGQTLRFTEDPVGLLNEPYIFNLATSSVDEINDGLYEISLENGNLAIKGDTSSILLVEVFDVAGIKTFESAATTSGDINVGNLKDGVYIIVIHTENDVISKKIEIE